MKKQRTPLQQANHVILMMHLCLPLWLFTLMYVPSFEVVLFPAVWAALLLNAAVYKITQRIGRGRPVLIAARVIAVCAMVTYYLPLVVMFGFARTQRLYPLKRWVYTEGVFSSATYYYQRMLPAQLPENTTDYSFRTTGSVLAQDAHASSYLIFRTDSETAAGYADFLTDAGFTARGEVSDPDLEGDFAWFRGWMRLDRYISEPLDHAQLFWINDRYPKVAIVDTASGLVAILT